MENIRMLRVPFFFLKPPAAESFITIHWKTTSAQKVASRARDPSFEKLMARYKNLSKIITIQDLIVEAAPSSISLDFLSTLSRKLCLNRSAVSFVRRYPHIFEIFYNLEMSKLYCKLTDAALEIFQLETAAINACLNVSVDRLVRLLSMSITKSLPLRAIFKVWRELGLPDDFEESIINRYPEIFMVCDGNEKNTHVLKLLDKMQRTSFTSAIEEWRIFENEQYTEDALNLCNEMPKSGPYFADRRTEIKFAFKHTYPPGMRLTKNFKAKVKQWQMLPYKGPYQEAEAGDTKSSKRVVMALEKRAVGIVHEFLSLTVEKIVEVEKISHFKHWFGIHLNVRNLFLDHPGIFYLSTKGKKHTVFLREAYHMGRLIVPNPVYNVRRKLLDLVFIGSKLAPV